MTYQEEKNTKTVLIFANGSYRDPSFYADYLKSIDNPFIIAVDGGLNFLDKINVKPDLLLGDLDSAEIQVVVKNKGIETFKFPSKKDFTDNELALEYCLEQGYSNVILFGSLSEDRLDHSLANIFLLEKYTKLGLNIRIVNNNNSILCLIGPVQKKYNFKSGNTLSVIALSEKVEGLNLVGFEYPLKDATLYRSSSLGISNKIKDKLQIISFKSGILLIDILKESL